MSKVSMASFATAIYKTRVLKLNNKISYFLRHVHSDKFSVA